MDLGFVDLTDTLTAFGINKARNSDVQWIRSKVTVALQSQNRWYHDHDREPKTIP